MNEAGACVAPDCSAQPTFYAAKLQRTPECGFLGNIRLVHVFYEGIVPEGSYNVQVVDCTTCDLNDEGNYYAPLAITATIWGDVLENYVTLPCAPPDGIVTFLDVTGTLGRCVSDPSSIRKTRADLEPACLDMLVNFSDVLFSVTGFQEVPYAFSPAVADPCNSQCTVLWPP